MHIKSVVIDGFKSYAHRTEINGFDPLFNAITGLNGSGKSNILDAICFLLGITNLTHVRASNLQDLVYKSGQAGITKATVSITFDNTEKHQSPIGYEQYNEITVTRQIVIGGRNKYFINGSNANNTRVQDLFRSVQLNVNNPHFLIMQGRITKVLNMKPQEILSMIEEAAGTRLYESKKEAALKTIEKKEVKLKEIDAILKEDITPTLAKLKDERSSYLEYQKTVRELEHFNKLYIAYQFVCVEEKKKRSAEDLVEMQHVIETLRTKITENEDTIKELTTLIAELEKKRDEESGSVLKGLEDALKEKKMTDAAAQSALTNKKAGLKGEQKKLKEIMKNLDDAKSTLASREKDLQKTGKDLDHHQEKATTDQKAHTAAQKHYQAVSAGLSSNDDGEAATLNTQLMAAKSEISTAQTETKQAQMKLKHAQQEVKKRQAELKKTEQSYSKDKSAFDAVQQNVNKLEIEMKKLSYEEGKEEKLSGEKRVVEQQVRDLQEQLDTLVARFPQLRFEYKDPEKNFDRRKVPGLVCNLIKVKDPATATGLEVAAGGKLYNVVVDTEVTGKKLLQKGELKRRYTIIPLNKISGRSIENNIVKNAEALVGKNNVSTALSLVGYEQEFVAAMKFVFGTCFVCKDMDAAKKVTYDPKVMKKTVTLGGDSFDPAGTLAGGSRKQTSSILLKLGEVREAEDGLNAKRQKLQQLEAELASVRKTKERYTQLKQQFDLKANEAEMVKSRLEQGSHHQQLEDITALQTSIDDQQEIQKKAEEVQKKAGQKVTDLEDKIKNAKAYREKELKLAEDGVTKAKKKMEESSKKLKEMLQETDSIKLELEELTKEITNYNEQEKATQEAIKEYEQQIADLTENAAETKAAVGEAQKVVNKQKEFLVSCNKDLNSKIGGMKEAQKEITATQLKIQELEHKIAKHHKDSKDAARNVEALLQKYEWIADEKKYFGQPNTAYDFQVNDPKEAERKITKLTESKDKLSKNVNMRAMNMLGKAEEQYNDLMKKRKIVQNDKKTISSVIAELDEKKNEALKKAWEQVNKDFGSIFSTLLPGTQAKLSPPEGQTVLQGLEVKIAFGDIWKESLGELSGGQRSLVALSLILAMLLFKPAPIYILDEVDAALDLSHTQNIGQMIKNHFKHSQFIVVSLKDGMFNNANVLYKTKFVDGVSTVTRYVQNASRSTSVSSNKENERTGKKKATTKRARIEEST